jgi:hypothetical protein
LACHLRCSARLQTIILRRNNLTGPLPAAWANLTSLHSIDLAINSFTGALPSEWRSFAQPMSIVLDRNAISGSLPEAWGSTPGFQLLLLNVSRNQIAGERPVAIIRNAADAAACCHAPCTLDVSARVAHGRSWHCGTCDAACVSLGAATRVPCGGNWYLGASQHVALVEPELHRQAADNNPLDGLDTGSFT